MHYPHGPSEFLVFEILEELRAIRILMEKMTQTSNDDEDLSDPLVKRCTQSVALPTNDEDPALDFERADAVRFAVSLEPLYAKSLSRTYDWRTANEAAFQFMKGKKFEYLCHLRDWCLELKELHGQLRVSSTMFDYLETLYKQNYSSWP